MRYCLSTNVGLISQKPSASYTHFQPCLKGFLRAQMCHAWNLIQLFIPAGAFKGASYQEMSSVQRVVYTAEVFEGVHGRPV